MNISATTFDVLNARECAQASADAYAGSTIAAADTDTQVLIYEYPGYTVVAFRGTSTLRDFITDAEFWRDVLLFGKTGKCAEVHRGFLKAFDSVNGQLTHHLSTLRDRPVFVTGHSLGGALAILAALELKRQGFDVRQVYTFGQPRVGNSEFKALYERTLPEEQTFRVVYEEDVVARIPHLPFLTDPYRHVGTEIFLPSLGGPRRPDYIINPSYAVLIYSDLRGLYRAWRASGNLGLIDDLLRDHHVANYVNFFKS